MTFSMFADIRNSQRGVQLVRPKDNDYRLKKITAFVLPRTEPPMTFGNKALKAITTDDIESLRDSRKAAGLSAVTINHDLKLLRKMFDWGIRRGYVERTPFKIGTESAVTLDKEMPRSKRFENDEDEQKLFDAANTHLRGVIIALLDTACRLGEVLSLQWKNVSMERREIVIEAAKANDGARLKGLQLRDLRHEAGSRFDEAGVPTNYVSKMLGHTNLTTTTRYLNIHRRGLHMAMKKVERHLAAKGVAQSLHTDAESAPAVVPASHERRAGKTLPS